MRGSMEERFWDKVDKNGPMIPNMGTNCWLWTAGTNGRYGILGRGRKGEGMEYAHRFACTLVNGPDPGGMDACHHCDNPLCVRPDHTFWGTVQDNMRDCKDKGRWNSGSRGSPTVRNGRCRLTPNQVAEIRELRASGWVYPKLSERFDISETQLARIVKREQWA